MKKTLLFTMLLALICIISLSSCDNSSETEDKKTCNHSYGEWYKEEPCDTLEWKKCKYCDDKDFRTVDANHQTNGSGVCVNCGTKIIYSQEEVKNIIQIQFFNLGEYDGGALSEIKIVFKNTSQKEIDEIFFGVTGYYNGESDVHRCTYPGNVKPGAVAGNGHYYEPLWPSSGMYGVKISSINITYTDGTKERIFDDNVQLAFWEYTEEEKYEDFLTNGLSNVKVGDVVDFGSYEQDNNTSNGEELIEWIVLAKENGKALLISKYCLDYQLYHNVDTAITWENSSSRNWLNTTFYNSAFSQREKGLIAESYLTNHDSAYGNIDGGNNTYDQVFLLSVNEAQTYFSSNNARKAQATQYALSKGVYYSKSTNSVTWLLRSPGDSANVASYVRLPGDIDLSQIRWDDDVYYYAALRPAVWVNIEGQPSHVWSSWQVKRNATCTTDGYKERVCSDCGETQTEIISSGHDYTEVTCTEDSYCRACNDVQTKALGHIDDRTNYLQDEGFYLCDRCGYNMVGTLTVSGEIVGRNGNGTNVTKDLDNLNLPAGTYKVTVTISRDSGSLYHWELELKADNAGSSDKQLFLNFEGGTFETTFTTSELYRLWFYSFYPCTYTITLETIE